MFKVVIFGAASAPTTWGRFAAFLGRSTALLTDARVVRQEIYVDDPIFVGVGAPERVSREIGVALLWGSALGYPFAWAKSDRGCFRHVDWGSHHPHP